MKAAEIKALSAEQRTAKLAELKEELLIFISSRLSISSITL